MRTLCRNKIYALATVVLISLQSLFLLASCKSQSNITGNWVSADPEKAATGGFSIRQFSFDNNIWEVRYTMYLDSLLTLPVFTFRGRGTFTVVEKSLTVDSAMEAVFRFDKKYITLKTRDTAVIRKAGLNNCGLHYLVETDITEKGCAYLVSRSACAQEYDLVSRSGKTLYLGARPASGGMCEASKRPVALGHPLKYMPN